MLVPALDLLMTPTDPLGGGSLERRCARASDGHALDSARSSTDDSCYDGGGLLSRSGAGAAAGGSDLELLATPSDPLGRLVTILSHDRDLEC